MANLLERFRSAGQEPEIDWGALKRQSMYPELIGRTVDDIKPMFGAECAAPYWMNCPCGILVMTTPDMQGKTATCAGCKQHQHDMLDGLVRDATPVTVTLKPQTERRMLFGLVVFCLMAAGVVGSSMWDAPPRAQASSPVQLD